MSFDARKTDGAGAAPVDSLSVDSLSDDVLPEDLAALAQQLCDDADRLAESYPADAQRQPRPLSRQSFWRGTALLRWGALAASLLMLIGGGVWIGGKIGDHSAGGGSIATSPTDTREESDTPETTRVVDVPIRPLVAVDQPHSGDARDRLTADVLKMTGPKLDAYGDIRAEEAETMESFSF